MSPDEAKRVVGAYLVGNTVSPQELEAACEVLASEGEYLRQLRDVHGSGPSIETGCQLFMARAAEFIDSSARQRREEMPEILSHLEQPCEECVDLYWLLQDSCWESTNVKSDQMATLRLKEAIHLATLPDGTWAELGVGPRSKMPETYASAMSASPNLSSELAQAKTWSFPMDALSCVIQMELSRRPNRAGFNMRLSCESAGPNAPDLGSATVRLRREQRPSGGREILLGESARLTPGAWSIRIMISGDVPSLWEIPLLLEEEVTL